MTLPQGSVLFCQAEPEYRNIASLLEASGLGERTAAHGKVLLKPNLVEALQPPITTPVGLIEAIIDYLLDFLPSQSILIGEGCGSANYDTFHTFDELGYSLLSSRKKITLIDLNIEKLEKLENPTYKRLPEIYLPQMLSEIFLISVPVLKAHSLAGVTLSLKNMMGCIPPSHYQEAGFWAKSSFHRELHQAIFELNRYRSPDFSILDASIGMAQAHLWGPQCDPPVGKIAASYDPVAIDSYGSFLLGRSWQDIDHISRAHQTLGTADPLQIVEID